PAGVARDVVMELLSALSLKPQTVELFNAYLRKTYHERISTLQRRRDAADDELKKTYELRQALIQKHLAGVYADDVFKEQNQLLNEKINTIKIAKSDEVLEQYNLEAMTEFVEDKFGNLPKTFEKSELLQKKTLMCSIFPSGVHWAENGVSNTKIAPFYRTILEFEHGNVSIGGPEGSRTPDLSNANAALYQ